MVLFKSRLFKIVFETFFSNSGDSSGAEIKIQIDINGSIVVIQLKCRAIK